MILIILKLHQYFLQVIFADFVFLLQVQAANILFVDNPVGTGYSYVDKMKALTTNATEIADDLVTLFGAFLAKYPDFEVWKYAPNTNRCLPNLLCLCTILVMKDLF